MYTKQTFCVMTVMKKLCMPRAMDSTGDFSSPYRDKLLGNGKSTLMKWIYNEELVEEYIQSKGTIVNILTRYVTGYMS